MGANIYADHNMLKTNMKRGDAYVKGAEKPY